MPIQAQSSNIQRGKLNPDHFDKLALLIARIQGDHTENITNRIWKKLNTIETLMIQYMYF